MEILLGLLPLLLLVFSAAAADDQNENTNLNSTLPLLSTL